MSIQVKIIKVSKNENTFKTKLPLIGVAPFEPHVGKSFIVFDENGPTQGFATSSVKEIIKTETGWILKTLNSEYKVDKINE